MEQHDLINSFLKIVAGPSSYTAKLYLEAVNWNLEDALQLYFIGSDDQGEATPAPSQAPPIEQFAQLEEDDESSSELSVGLEEEDESSSELSVELEEEDERCSELSAELEEEDERNSSVSTAHNLADLYRPRFDLMFRGPFEKAKETAMVQNKWLLVNIQSIREFNSHLLNRDTWSNQIVAETVKSFIFWQKNDDTIEGKKVCTYYGLFQDSNNNYPSLPVIMVIDPITGHKLSSWHGMVQPETLLENLSNGYMDYSPSDYHLNLSNQRLLRVQQAKNHGDHTKQEDQAENIDEESRIRGYPALPEEPDCGDTDLVCRVGVRLPDGRSIQRNFLRSEPIQLLWSFVYSELEGEAKARPFELVRAIPGSSKSLDYDEELTFGTSGIANTMISVTNIKM